MMKPLNHKHFQNGDTLLEVLVTMVILAFGLLGLAGLQTRLEQSELESYQRAQGLILLEDMASKITVNRNNAASYVTGPSNPLGTGMSCPASAITRQNLDTKDWCNSLKGAAETSGTSLVGAFIGGRGCIEDLGSGQYMITVSWQGIGPTGAPPSSIACGKNSYNNTTACNNDQCRKVLTTIVGIASL